MARARSLAKAYEPRILIVRLQHGPSARPPAPAEIGVVGPRDDECPAAIKAPIASSRRSPGTSRKSVSNVLRANTGTPAVASGTITDASTPTSENGKGPRRASIAQPDWR